MDTDPDIVEELRVILLRLSPQLRMIACEMAIEKIEAAEKELREHRVALGRIAAAAIVDIPNDAVRALTSDDVKRAVAGLWSAL